MKRLIATTTFLISISCFAGDWIQVENWAVPLKVNPNAMEELLWEHISKNTPELFYPRERYTYQYKTINKQELLINAFCDPESHKNLSKQLVFVLDGGACYFQAKYNFKTNTFVSLSINGHA